MWTMNTIRKGAMIVHDRSTSSQLKTILESPFILSHMMMTGESSRRTQMSR